MSSGLVRRLGHHPTILIKKLILVAPGKIAADVNEKKTSTQTGETLSDKDYEPIQDLYNFTIDTTIQNRISDGIIVYTSNDSQRLLDSADLYIKALGAQHIIIPDRGYFNGSYGSINKTFPELMNIILH